MRFLRTAPYLRDLKRIGLADDERAAVEGAIARDPMGGDVVVGLGGVRKMRFPMRGRGKSGGGRVVYLLIVTDDTAALPKAYAKSEKADLTQDDRRAIAAMVREIKG